MGHSQSPGVCAAARYAGFLMSSIASSAAFSPDARHAASSHTPAALPADRIGSSEAGARKHASSGCQTGLTPLCDRRLTTGDQPPETSTRSQSVLPPARQLFPCRMAVVKPETALPPSAFIGAASSIIPMPAVSQCDRNDEGISCRESSIVTLAPEPARSDAVVYAESLLVAMTIFSPA